MLPLENIGSLLKKHWGPGYFKRYMDERWRVRFSGDMISGMLLAIVMLHIRVGLTLCGVAGS